MGKCSGLEKAKRDRVHETDESRWSAYTTFPIPYHTTHTFPSLFPLHYCFFSSVSSISIVRELLK